MGTMGMNKKKIPAVLALADGKVFRGFAFGDAKPVERASVGEMVFNTSMFGYQEILTDPSYAGQTLCFTYPHIGNVGCNEEDDESNRVHATGLVIRELSPVTSNFRAKKSLTKYLEERGVMGIEGIETRDIVSHLRDFGAQMGAMAAGDKVNPADLVSLAKGAGSMEGRDYVREVSCTQAYTWNEGSWSLEQASTNQSGFVTFSEEALAARPHVVAIDCGVKRNILRLLVDAGFRVTVVPATANSAQILALKPDGLFLSNGPGDPATLNYVVSNVRNMVGKTAIFGICLGHQILGQVFGGKTYKLKYGHRGGNHPVKDLQTGKVEITVQNHGFAVESRNLPKELTLSHVNLNDQTVEGLEAKGHNAFCVQYHPEASPGPHDSAYLFRRFFERVVNPQQ